VGAEQRRGGKSTVGPTNWVLHCLTEPLHLTAARVRFGMNLNGYVGAAARDGEC
jgi:hypothetical protein